MSICYAPDRGPHGHGHGRQGNFINEVLLIMIRKEKLNTSCRVFESRSKYRRMFAFFFLCNSAQTKALRRAVPNVTSSLSLLVVYLKMFSIARTVEWW